jgi:predicted DNA-binding protein YlxM (UPF0122 family)
MLEKVNRLNYLFDFYGTLLTERQQRAMEMYYKDDFSLAEAAEHLSISRQAVHDILSRAVVTLENWEKKLNLYASYLQRKEDGRKVLELLARRPLQEEDLDAIKEIVRRNMVDN